MMTHLCAVCGREAGLVRPYTPTLSMEREVGRALRARRAPCCGWLSQTARSESAPYLRAKRAAAFVTGRARALAAFTMIEIAIAIAVIGFALVAIIGVLPTAMRVQQDNRADTLIDQDGVYFMEAIRHGSQGLDDLRNYVYEVNFIEMDPNTRDIKTVPATIIPPKRIIGALSTPLGYSLNNDSYQVIRVEAKVHSISGAAIEKDPQMPATFDYLLTSEVTPFFAFDSSTAFPTTDPLAITNTMLNLQNHCHDLRLTFRWPFSSVTGKSGNNKKVYRNLVSGSLVNYTNDYFFFEPTNFVANP